MYQLPNTEHVTRCPKCGEMKAYDTANPFVTLIEIILILATFGLYFIVVAIQSNERKNIGWKLKCDKCGYIWYE